MDKASEITKSRQLLQNPYAYLDGGCSYSASRDTGKLAGSLSQQIADHRYLLEDPYAYLDGDGTFSALEYPKSPSAKRRRRYSNAELEQKAKDLHRIIWKNRTRIWGEDHPSDLVDMLDPTVALNLIGYDFDLDETLGQSHINGRLLEVAGIIDNSSRRVRISRQFPNDVRVFTAAHELGHALLHEARGLHRDRPLDGETLSRHGIEFEADKFATYFLMPEKLVRARFASFFATDRFVVDEDTAFALSRISLPEFRQRFQTLRDVSRALANAEYYDGRRFISMARQFRVSVGAMAIRLEELGLLAV